MTESSQIKIGAILSYFAIFLNVVSGLLFTPWMITQIGQRAYGLYTLSNSIVTLFLFDFGLSAATARFVSKYRAEGNQQKVDNILGAIYKLYLVITLVIFAGFAVFSLFIDPIFANLSPTEREQFKVIYSISAAFAIIQFPCVTLNGILTAYEKFVWMKLADILYRVSFVVCTTIALLLGYGLYALVTIHALAGVLGIVLKLLVIRNTTPVSVNFGYKERNAYKAVFLFSVWVTVSSFAQRASFNFMPTVLGIVCKDAAVAISVFGIISTMESYAYLIPGAINGIFMPRIAKICADDNVSRLDSLLNDVGKFQFFVNGLILAGFAVTGKNFLVLWLGESYAEAYAGILLVLLPGVYYNSLQIANTTMIVMNQVKHKAKVDCAMAVMNVALAFPLALCCGVTGACVAILIAYTFRVVALMVVYKSVLPMNMLRFVKNCFVNMSVPVAATIGVGLVLNRLLPDSGWLTFFQKVILVTGIYTIFVLILGLGKTERRRLLAFLRK